MPATLPPVLQALARAHAERAMRQWIEAGILSEQTTPLLTWNEALIRATVEACATYLRNQAYADSLRRWAGLDPAS